MPAGECERCGTFRKWLHKHHIWPRSEGGTDADGTELLCANCHEDEHDSPFGQKIWAQRRRAAREAAVPADELRAMYEDEGLSIREIAARLGTASSNVQYWMRDYGIERRVGHRPRGTEPPPPGELASLYATKTTYELGAMFGVSQMTAHKWLKEAGVPLRRRGEQPTR